MPILRYFSSTAQPTTLTGGISSGSTTINVGATTGFPPTTPYTLALDFGGAAEELVDVTGVASLSLTVTRAVDGTSAQSHGVGAVVRHVYSARDASDYQSHQSATAAVHGTVGTVVGTSDTQTLSGKTLTSPTINGATTTGTVATGTTTFTGTPTFSDAVIFTGNPLFQGGATTTDVAGTIVSGDSNRRLIVNADGKLDWGPGNAVADVELYRGAADVLETLDTVRTYRPTTTSDAIQTRVTGDTVSRLNIDADGTLNWGPGGASAQDTNLYRSAANTLKTDDSLVVGTNLSVTGDATVTGNLAVTGIGQMLTALKTADTTRASTTTLTSDPHLTFSVVAGATYLMDGFLVYASTAAADIQIAFTSPASTSGAWASAGVGLGTSASTTNGYPLRIEASQTLATLRIYAGTGSSDFYGIPMNGTIRTTNSGTFALQWAQQVSDAVATTLAIDSWLRLHRIA